MLDEALAHGRLAGSRLFQAFRFWTVSGWARAHMAREPRPVGPVIQVAAEVIVAAASRSAREIWLSSTFATILGNLVLLSYLDGYLARRLRRPGSRKAHSKPGAVASLAVIAVGTTMAVAVGGILGVALFG